MGPKKKDLMSDAFEGFWQSGSIPQHKLNTPRIKSAEDENWDSFWGRGNYTPVRKIPSASRGSTYVKNVQPVKYSQKERLAELKARFETQKVQAQINAMNAKQFQENVKAFREAGRESYNVARGAYRTAAPVVRKAVEKATPIVKRAARSAVEFVKKATDQPVKQEPVGLAGALHEARIKSGQSSIYK
jgi:hypothetical protein